MKNYKKLFIVACVVCVGLATLIGFKTTKADSGLHGLDLFYSILAERVDVSQVLPNLGIAEVVEDENTMLGYSRAKKRIEYVYDFKNGINVNGTILPDYNGTIDLGGFDSAWADFFVSGTSYMNNVIVSGTLSTVSTTYLDATASTTALTVAQYANFDGNTYIGNATGDTLTITARLISDVDPNAHNTYDFGTYGLAYKSIYASGTAAIGGVLISGQASTITLGTSTASTLTITSRINADLDPDASNTYNLGAEGLAYKNIYTSSTAFLAYSSSTIVEVSTSLLPDANAGADIGAFGTAFNDMYVSNTAFVGDLSDLLYIDKVNGRIGVATTSPATDLDVYNTGTSTLIVDSSDSAKGGRMILKDTDGSGCSEVTVKDGTAAWKAVTCP